MVRPSLEEIREGTVQASKRGDVKNVKRLQKLLLI